MNEELVPAAWSKVEGGSHSLIVESIATIVKSMTPAPPQISLRSIVIS
jgi:hypothetical protein